MSGDGARWLKIDLMIGRTEFAGLLSLSDSSAGEKWDGFVFVWFDPERLADYFGSNDVGFGSSCMLYSLFLSEHVLISRIEHG